MQLLWLLLSLGLLVGALSNAPTQQYDASLLDVSNLSNFDLSALLDHPKSSKSNSSGHERRWLGDPPAPASDAVWEAAKCKGRKFMAQMSYSDYDVGQSLPVPANTARRPWYFYHLGAWGYMMSGVGEVYRNLESGGYWGVADLLRHISISDKCVEEGGQWRAAVITHYVPGTRVAEQTYVGPDGHKRRMSGAYFYMAVNPQGGIIVQNTLGPRSAADSVYPNNFPDTELPPLQKLSDMMWSMWEFYITPDQRSKIDFFMSLGISNPTSAAHIRRALDSEGQSLSTTPYKLDPSSDGGLAYSVRSPNGARVAHFLTQRKLNIGLKTVVGIYIFECLSKAKSPCLMIKVGDLAAPAPRPQAAQPGPLPETNLNAPIDGEGARERVQQKRSIVRVHTFRYDGNVTVSSEYV